MGIRILICDDQALVRAGFKLILDAEDDLEVVGEAGDGTEAVELAPAANPDVILMDVRMPNMNGIEATKTITTGAGDEGPKVLILTTFDLDEYVYEALRAGASGFLLKDGPADQLVAAIRTVAGGGGPLGPPRPGGAVLPPTVTRRLIEEFARAAPPAAPAELADLTARERTVLEHLARGLSNA